jgi:Rrf2 family protein
MRLNKKTQVGMMFAMYLTKFGATSLSEVAKDLEVSEAFLSKIAVILKNKGVVSSARGRGGGYMLTNPGSVTMYNVLIALTPNILLTMREVEELTKGNALSRTLLYFSVDLYQTMKPVLTRKLSYIVNDLILAEGSQLAKSKLVSKSLN